jgi:hypothetical protein
MESGTKIQLENMVPLGEKPVPFFSVHNTSRDAFEESVSKHPSVQGLQVVSNHDEETVFALDWMVSRDIFFQGISEAGAQLISASGSAESWRFELRFPTHDALSEFKEYCDNAHITLEVGRIYNPTRPGTGPWYGLTETQRETLITAVESGYYSIPRTMSTKELAAMYDISDQAATERLRRAIKALVENTLITSMEEEKQYEPAE